MNGAALPSLKKRLWPFNSYSNQSSKADTPCLISVTSDINELPACKHFLLYLNGETWTRGEQSELLAIELDHAMDDNVHLLLAHEMIGLGGQENRHGCNFADFFECERGQTPDTLLRRGVYTSIAVPLRGGPLRRVSLAMLVSSIADNRGVENIFGSEAMELQRALPMKFKSGEFQKSSAGRTRRQSVIKQWSIRLRSMSAKSKHKGTSSTKYDATATSRDTSSQHRAPDPYAAPADVDSTLDIATPRSPPAFAPEMPPTDISIPIAATSVVDARPVVEVNANLACVSSSRHVAAELDASQPAAPGPPEYDENYRDGGSGIASQRESKSDLRI